MVIEYRVERGEGRKIRIIVTESEEKETVFTTDRGKAYKLMRDLEAILQESE